MDRARALIRGEARRRGITRLCHFTRLLALPGIVDAGGVLSREALGDHGVPHRPNDLYRLDHHLGYVSCSIQYPNLFVLDHFTGGRASGWVILELDPALLWDPETLFCDTNAAKFHGQNISGGFDKFMRMFADRPSARHLLRSRAHLPSTPTDLQAEVLVFDAVRLDQITGILASSEADAQQIVTMLGDHGLGLRVETWPEIFSIAEVKHHVRKGRELTMSANDAQAGGG